jgi:predicted phosphodiesterase
MKILVLSDLHCEFHEDHGRKFVDSLPTGQHDVVVLAGDIAMQRHMFEVLGMFCEKFRHVIYVTGNHEYYRSDRGKVNATIRKIKSRHQNLHVLDKDIVEIDGQRFLGATLWFSQSRMSEALRPHWSDFACIVALHKWVYQENSEALNFFNREIKAGDIVISHHMPAWQSVHPKYAQEPSNCYYVTDVSPLIMEREPAFWIHGHTHESCDYTINKTRIVCNPYGYEGFADNHGGYTRGLNPNFRLDFTLETGHEPRTEEEAGRDAGSPEEASG